MLYKTHYIGYNIKKVGEIIKKYRNEWKYCLTNQELSLLKSRISEVLELDPHTPKSGRYVIHSLYFDDYKDTAVYTKDSGLLKRFKWRIRYYDDDLSFIALERKEKLNNRCHKKKCLLTLKEYKKIVSGNILDIVYDTDKELIKELARDIMLYNYTPKVIIDYERIAYVEEITNVRVTFDVKIRASSDIDHFLDRDYTSFYINPSGVNVLEVKFNDILPSHIRKIIESYGFKQTAFSKYYYGRKIIDSYLR